MSRSPDLASPAAQAASAHAPFVDGRLRLADPLPLEHGGGLAGVELAYRLAGIAGGPVVAVLGGISAGRRVCAAGPAQPGWWDEIVGPGLALDTERYRVLSFDYLGGSGESSGPASGQTYPSISSFDQAGLLQRLLRELAIERLRACVGSSYGGMVALAFAARHAGLLDRAIVISAAHRTHPMSTAWRSVQRAVVRYALSHGEGARGLSLARALAQATYRSAREFEERFGGEPVATAQGFRFPVEEYLFARGASYAGQYRPESFVCLSESIDLHRVDPAGIVVPVTGLAVVEDQLVPLSDMRYLRDHLAGGCQLIEIESVFGHDAFLKEHEVLRDLFARAL